MTRLAFDAIGASKRCVNEGVQIPIENGVDVASFNACSMVDHARFWCEYVASDLASKAVATLRGHASSNSFLSVVHGLSCILKRLAFAIAAFVTAWHAWPEARLWRS